MTKLPSSNQAHFRAFRTGGLFGSVTNRFFFHLAPDYGDLFSVTRWGFPPGMFSNRFNFFFLSRPIPVPHVPGGDNWSRWSSGTTESKWLTARYSGWYRTNSYYRWVVKLAPCTTITSVHSFQLLVSIVSIWNVGWYDVGKQGIETWMVHTKRNQLSAPSSRHKDRMSRFISPLVVRTKTVRTSLSDPTQTLVTTPLGQRPLGVSALCIRTKSPSFKFLCGRNHLLAACRVGTYSFSHRFQNTLLKWWACRQRLV